MYRILKCFDRLRSNFHKLVSFRLNTFGFWNSAFITFNLKIIFQNCWHNNLKNPLFSNFTVKMYDQLVDPSQHCFVGVICDGLQTGKTWMMEQIETSELKILLTDNGCAYFGGSKGLFFIVFVVLCLPSIFQYDIRSNRTIAREVLKCTEIFLFASFISFGSLKSKNSHKNLENSAQN